MRGGGPRSTSDDYLVDQVSGGEFLAAKGQLSV